jgi:hypothetical protein
MIGVQDSPYCDLTAWAEQLRPKSSRCQLKQTPTKNKILKGWAYLQKLALKKNHAQEPQKRPACGLTPLLGLLGVAFVFF